MAKDKKEVTVTSVTVVKKYGAEKNADKDALAEKCSKALIAAGKTKSKSGKVINKAYMLDRVNAIVADIKKDRKGWWSLYKVVEEKDNFQILPKAQN